MMGIYEYKAIDMSNKDTVNARVEAADMRSAKQKLRQMGLMVQKLTPVSEQRKGSGKVAQGDALGKFIKRVSQKDIHLFTQQLSSILEAGLPLIEALFMLEQQQSSKSSLKVHITEIRQDIINGNILSAAMAKTAIFDRLYIALVRSGEQTGELDKALRSLAELMHSNIVLKNKIKGAMMYPLITSIIITGVVIAMLLFVIPQFKDFFSTQGKSLPLITLSLITISTLFQQFWWMVMLAVGGCVYWFNTFRKGVGKKTVDGAILKLPIIGPLVCCIYTLRFIGTLSTLLGGGIIMTEALQTSSNTVSNAIFKEAFQAAQDAIMLGGNITKPLEQANIMPPMACKMMLVGEQSGEMEKMLSKACVFIEEEVEIQINALTEIIQPVLTLIMGGVLLYIIVAIYLPVFSMTKGI